MNQEKEAELKMSVVVCTHNPHVGRFGRVLESLREQTLGRGEWELLLVDNSSKERLSGRVDLRFKVSRQETGVVLFFAPT